MNSNNREALYRLQDIRAQINAQPLEMYVQLQRDSNGKPCCPICGSGTGKHGTSALKIYPDTNRVKCFSGNCFGDKGEDTLGALEKIWECTEREAIERAGYSLENSGRAREYTPRVKQEKPREEKKLIDYSEKYTEWHTSLLQAPEALEYLHSRGITDESIEAFNLGYCATWVHPNASKPYTSRRIIVPRSEYSYLARCIDAENTARKLVVGTQKVIFNARELDDSTAEEPYSPVVLVEGELDAISIVQASYSRAIGIGSITNAIELVETIKRINPDASYILALDNDKAGKEAQKKLADALEAAGIFYIAANTEELYNGCKDANAACVQDADALAERVGRYLAKAVEEKDNRQDELNAEAYAESGAGAVDTFLQAIESTRYKPMPTGIGCVDKALGGGITRQSLTIVAGSPGIGKTVFVSQLCETMAKGAADRSPLDVLYINLEMSREQLMARSIARLSAQDNGVKLEYLEIMRGYEWTAEKKRRVFELAEEYKRTIAQHMVYNPRLLNETEERPASLNTIIAKIEQEKQRLGKAPDIIVIDYLQLVETESNNGSADLPAEAIKKTVSALKKIAIDDNCAVVAITASNRASINTGVADLTSGRDTSAIEYSADLHIGLTYESIEAKNKYPDENGKEAPITLETIKRIRAKHFSEPDNGMATIAYMTHAATIRMIVNKNRIGAEGAYAVLTFDGKYMLLREADLKHLEEGYRDLARGEVSSDNFKSSAGKKKLEHDYI